MCLSLSVSVSVSLSLSVCYSHFPVPPVQCACGDMLHCENGCNCGFGAEGVDEGVIMDMDQLPLTKVTFRPSSGTPGTVYVGKLRCGPQPFGNDDNNDDNKNNNIKKNDNNNDKSRRHHPSTPS